MDGCVDGWFTFFRLFLDYASDVLLIKPVPRSISQARGMLMNKSCLPQTIHRYC